MDRALVDAVADAIAASHAVAPPASVEPWIKSISMPSSKAIPRAFRTAGCFPADDIDDLEAASLSTFSRIRKSLLEQRGEKADMCGGATATCTWRTSF